MQGQLFDGTFWSVSHEARARQQRAFAGFRRYAFVVRTAVGRLQVGRLSREGAENAGVFFDVAEARLFCREGLGGRP